MSLAKKALEQGEGILRLSPTWVPRSFCVPGRRIKLHPYDYYMLGGARGGIDERWLSSTTPAQNGPLTSKNEGLIHVVFHDGQELKLFLLKDAIDELKGEIIGSRIWDKYKSWPMYSKFFDNMGPLPHHVHYDDKISALTGQVGKPEAYYFPPQLNNHGGDFPYTFFGISPGTTKDQIKTCLMNFNKGDNSSCASLSPTNRIPFRAFSMGRPIESTERSVSARVLTRLPSAQLVARAACFIQRLCSNWNENPKCSCAGRSISMRRFFNDAAI